MEGWNHNTHYHDRLLRHVPAHCRRALDVGCGTGAFARQLAAVSEHVDALERDPATARHARELSGEYRNIHFIEDDFLAWKETDGYDFVSLIAVVHHLPFDAALIKSAELLRPGGVLVVLGLDRPRTLAHALAQGLIAYPVSAAYRAVRHTAAVGASIREPIMTLPEIKRAAATLLPGVTVHRHLLWRYSLVWTKSESSSSYARPATCDKS